MVSKYTFVGLIITWFNYTCNIFMADLVQNSFYKCYARKVYVISGFHCNAHVCDLLYVCIFKTC